MHFTHAAIETKTWQAPATHFHFNQNQVLAKRIAFK